MLKKRIIPVQLLLDGRLVKTVNFGAYRDVGDPVKSSKVYSDQFADELVFLNVSRDRQTIEPMIEILEATSEVCFMPLAIGGGIREFDQARRLILEGADKVVLNSVCYRRPEVVTEIGAAFGAQAVIVSVDVRRRGDGWSCWSDCGRVQESISLDAHLDAVVKAGAGEILINSIDRDGTMTGYDVPLLRHVAKRVPIPVIGCGGAGTYEHMKEAFLGGDVDALACGSLFNFGDNNPIRAKAHLSNAGIPFKVI